MLVKHSPGWTSHLPVGFPALLCRNTQEMFERRFTTVSAILDSKQRRVKRHAGLLAFGPEALTIKTYEGSIYRTQAF